LQVLFGVIIQTSLLFITAWEPLFDQNYLQHNKKS